MCGFAVDDEVNHHRPHSTLGHVPAAKFAAQCAGGTAQTPASTTGEALGLPATVVVPTMLPVKREPMIDSWIIETPTRRR